MFEVIDRSERGELRITEFDFNTGPGDGRRIEGYYTEHPEPALMGIQAGLSADLRRSLEIEARACFRDPPSNGREKFWVSTIPEQVEPARINRLRAVIGQEAPDWVAAIEGQAAVYGLRNTTSVIFWSGVPLVPALAILANLKHGTP